MRACSSGWLVVSGLVMAATVVGIVAPAFACTGTTSLTSWPTRAPAGAAFTVEAKGFEVTSGVGIKWGGPSGRALGTVAVNAAGSFVGEFTVPSDATVRPGAALGYYQLTAVQTKSDGTTFSSSIVFEVQAPAAGPAEPAGPAGPTLAAPQPAASQPAAPQPAAPQPAEPAVAGSPSAPAAAPNLSGAPEPAVVTPSRPATTIPSSTAVAAPSASYPGPTAAGTAVIATPAPPAPPDGVAAAAAPAPALAPVAELADPAAADLWSAVDAERRPSLLDVPTASRQGAIPVSAILLVTGAAVLGLALVAGLRRSRLAAVARR